MFKPIPKLDYHAMWDIDENTGIVLHKGTVKHARNNYCKKGMPVGSWRKHTQSKHYEVCHVRIGKYGMFHLARILYYVYFGIDAKNKIVDHIDGNTRNMAKSNLRLTNHSNSAINRGMFKNNTTGIIGVCKNNKNFKAEIQIRNKRHRKITDDFFEACCWRKSMEHKLGFDKIKAKRLN